MPPKSQPSAGTFSLPLYYRAFFLFLEPISALAGFAMAFFRPSQYLALTDPPFLSSTSNIPIPVSTHIVLHQLANLYFLFAFNEAFILRSTSDMRVWRTLILGMLIADFGHLWSVSGHAMGSGIYWKIWQWNAMDWGNVGFVYVGILSRVCFLMGVGMPGKNKGGKSK